MDLIKVVNSPERNIFRKESLDRLSSPEQLDSLMQVVMPGAWIGLLGFCILISGAVVWSFWGRIPQRVSAAGVLLNQSQVVDLQSPIDGQVTGLQVQEGDCLQGVINPRQASGRSIVAAIDPSDLKQQRQQQ